MAGLLQSSIVAAEEPAVSSLNGKLSVQGGDANGKSGALLDAVVTAPVGHSFGVQLDASNGHVLDTTYNGIGGHFFWRDPSQGLVGLVSSHQKLGDTSMNRFGVEGERYFQDFSLRARAGHQSGDVDNGSFGSIGARWYANENLAIGLGYDESPGNVRSTGLGVEWQPSSLLESSALSIFAHVDNATGGNHMAMVGVRYYFDEKKTLIRRHRTADPDTLLMGGGSNLNPFFPVQKPAPACLAPKQMIAGACVLPPT